MALFAYQNHMFDKHLRKYDTLHSISLMNVFLLVAAILVSIARFILTDMHAPSLKINPLTDQSIWPILALCGLIYLGADFAYISAYAFGGATHLITITPVLLPVFLSFIQIAEHRSAPTPQLWIGWIIIGIGLTVVCTAKTITPVLSE